MEVAVTTLAALEEVGCSEVLPGKGGVYIIGKTVPVGGDSAGVACSYTSSSQLPVLCTYIINQLLDSAGVSLSYTIINQLLNSAGVAQIYTTINQLLDLAGVSQNYTTIK